MRQVSITIPTYNSEKTIGSCLESLKNQTFKDFEVIIVDSYSKDRTLDVVEKYKKDIAIKVIQTDWRLLGARYLGFKESKGRYHLMLDSDQILERTALERAVNLIENEDYDMLILEEKTYEPRSFVQKLFQADRELVHKLFDIQKDVVDGTLLPRFFRREILEAVFREIPEEIMKIAVAWDHTIIYYEAVKISQKIGLLENAVYHIEPDSVWKVIKKFYRYGKTTKELIKTLENMKVCRDEKLKQKAEEYLNLIKRKASFRKGAWKYPELAVKSYLLLVFKGIGYKLGEYL